MKPVKREYRNKKLEALFLSLPDKTLWHTTDICRKLGVEIGDHKTLSALSILARRGVYLRRLKRGLYRVICVPFNTKALSDKIVELQGNKD